MPAVWWQERPLKHIKLLSLFIPQRIIDQSELWCCFNNAQFTIHWLPSTHSIINFTDLFSKSTWFCTIWGEGGGRGGQREKGIFSPFLYQNSQALRRLGRLAANRYDRRRDRVWCMFPHQKVLDRWKLRSLWVPCSVAWEHPTKEARWLSHRAMSRITLVEKKLSHSPSAILLQTNLSHMWSLPPSQKLVTRAGVPTGAGVGREQRQRSPACFHNPLEGHHWLEGGLWKFTENSQNQIKFICNVSIFFLINGLLCFLNLSSTPFGFPKYIHNVLA